ncbi:MAG: carbohydrate ABC transporter substrate-binding protein, partial [Clostridia bacterium]|nr:carbohydrate ABC transporter substrate-binding protein [Clostridia bacterium]
MKQLIALFFCLILLIPASIFAEEVEISLWTYPIGGWGSEESVRPIIDAFNAVHPEITVSVR